MSEYYLTKSDELYHYGVKGQQWGRRQYQNTDGSLTELGRQHYGYGPARQRMLDARANYRSAQKAWGKAYDRAINLGGYARLFTKKGREEQAKREDEMVRTANAAEKARLEYKSAKKEYRNSDEHKARVKKAIKIGAAIAGTALVAYGAYKVSQVVRNKRALSSGQNLAATAKFQETLSKRYNDVIGNMNGRDSDISKKYFNKNQALKTNLARTQSQLQSQNARETTERFKSNLANRYNNVVGNMNGRDSAKAKRYYDARKALTAPAERAAANAARSQKVRDTATSVRNSLTSAFNKTQSALKNASNNATLPADRNRVEKIRSEMNGLLSRANYYNTRSKTTAGIDAESRIAAKRELSKIMSELGTLQNQLQSISNKRRG